MSRRPRRSFRSAGRAREGLTWELQLAPGMVDPLFLCELALEMHMPVGEMCDRMSARELYVVWPAYFRWREAERERQELAR